MTTPSAPADTAPAANVPASRAVPLVPARPSWPWRRGGPIPAGAAQLITISAEHAGYGSTSDYPLVATWWSLRPAIAPAPVAAVAAFAPAPVNLLAGVVGVLVLLVGIAGGILHISVFFVPALVVLAVGTVKLWREQP
jgi:hypothetical protein